MYGIIRKAAVRACVCVRVLRHAEVCRAHVYVVRRSRSSAYTCALRLPVFALLSEVYTREPDTVYVFVYVSNEG